MPGMTNSDKKSTTSVLLLLHEWSPPPGSTRTYKCTIYSLHAQLPPLICPCSPTIKAKNNKIKETN